MRLRWLPDPAGNDAVAGLIPTSLPQRAGIWSQEEGLPAASGSMSENPGSVYVLYFLTYGPTYKYIYFLGLF